MTTPTPKDRAQEILAAALLEIRGLGLAPVFKWGKNAQNIPHRLAVNVDDFDDFLEVPN